MELTEAEKRIYQTAQMVLSHEQGNACRAFEYAKMLEAEFQKRYPVPKEISE